MVIIININVFCFLNPNVTLSIHKNRMGIKNYIYFFFLIFENAWLHEHLMKVNNTTVQVFSENSNTNWPFQMICIQRKIKVLKFYFFYFNKQKHIKNVDKFTLLVWY